MDGQPAETMTIEEAVGRGIVANETLGYHMARTHTYLVKVGVNLRRLRFRQRLGNEMAHYAQDCWDAEILTSYGWIECVGNVDRSCYDLTQHSKTTNVKGDGTGMMSIYGQFGTKISNYSTTEEEA